MSERIATQKMSLGEALRFQEAERKRLGALAVQERERLAQEEFKANERKIAEIFLQAQSAVTNAVALNHKVVPVEMNDSQPFVFGGGVQTKVPSNPAHPYHHIFKDAETWGHERDLELRFSHTHDGGGMRSWYNVTYGPRSED